MTIHFKRWHLKVSKVTLKLWAQFPRGRFEESEIWICKESRVALAKFVNVNCKSSTKLGNRWPYDFDSKELKFDAIILKTRSVTFETLKCHLLKEISSHSGEVTPEPRFRGLVLDHQVSKQPEAKNLSKIANFNEKHQFLSVSLALTPLKLHCRALNP